MAIAVKIMEQGEIRTKQAKNKKKRSKKRRQKQSPAQTASAPIAQAGVAPEYSEYLTPTDMQAIREMRRKRGISAERTVTISEIMEATDWRIARQLVHRSKPPAERTKKARTIKREKSTAVKEPEQKEKKRSPAHRGRQRRFVVRQESVISDVTFNHSIEDAVRQRRMEQQERVKYAAAVNATVAEVESLQREERTKERIRKQPNDLWDLLRDSRSSDEYDVSTIGTLNPPSKESTGISSYKSKQTLDISEFDRPMDIGQQRHRGDSAKAKKPPAIPDKAHIFRELQRIEQQRLEKQATVTAKIPSDSFVAGIAMMAPQPLVPNPAFNEKLELDEDESWVDFTNGFVP